MSTTKTIAVVSAAALALGGCRIPGLHGEAKAPTGQVVATVEGQEITQRELEAELGNVNVADPAARKIAERQALQTIIVRDVLADAARKQKLDKTPEYALLRERAQQSLLAGLLEKKVVDSVPAPTADEIQQYISDHPDQFAQRKIWSVDLIRFSPTSEAIVKGLTPLNTMPDIETYLTAKHIAFQQGSSEIDALSLDPQAVDQIVKLPPTEVFIIPAGGMLVANQIRSTQIKPLTGADATKAATALLKRKRTQEVAQRTVSQLMAQAAPTIKYNPAFNLAPPATAKK